MPVQLEMLRSTGRYDAFNLKPIEYYKKPYNIWPVPDWLFWESDVAKWVEGACYALQQHPDEKTMGHVKYLVDLIESAQQPDGYLNIHFVVVAPNERWSNLRDLHELYNGGHLIEAALAHQKLTGSDQFVNVMLRFVHYVASIFGPEQDGKRPGYPGHPEIELALLRLYHRTHDVTSLRLAEYFISERGRGNGEFYRQEQAKRGEHPMLAPSMMPKAGSYWYMQAQDLIENQETIEGHSVRATYLLTAVADLVSINDKDTKIQDRQRQALVRALYRLWDNMTQKKMYVTGGIGSVKQWEGFSIDYSLPQGTDDGGGYAETCAGIGVVMVAERMLALRLDRSVADVAEVALYNGSVTTGMSRDGRSFTYENQLASSASRPCQRHDWFECACCPPNVMRNLAVIGGFFWSTSGADLVIHHYFSGKIKSADGRCLVTMQTNYPNDGVININVHSKDEDGHVLIRVPQWAQQQWTVNPQSPLDNATGYVRLNAGNNVLTLPMHTRFNRSDPRTGQDTLTLMRGPLVYCVEDVDNTWEEGHFKYVCFDPTYDLRSRSKLIEEDGVVKVRLEQAGYHLAIPQNHTTPLPLGLTTTNGMSQENQTQTPSTKRAYVEEEGQGQTLTFIPFYYRANRRKTGVQMRTSLRCKS
jgi:hypothetical protein